MGIAKGHEGRNRKRKLSQGFQKVGRKLGRKNLIVSPRGKPNLRNSHAALATALRVLGEAISSLVSSLLTTAEDALTTKWPRWLDEEKKRLDAERVSTKNRHQELTSEGWAGVMVLLGIVLAFVMAWKNGLL